MAGKQRKKLSAKVFTIIIASLLAVAWVIAIVMPIVLTTQYDAVMRDFFGTAGRKTEGVESEETKNLDKQYNKSDFESVAKLEEYEKEFVRSAGAEGFVLLKNSGDEAKGLPIKTSESAKTKISLFSKNSVNMIAGGTGSGVGYINGDLKTALELQNYEVNEQLWNFYKTGTGSTYKLGEGVINFGSDSNWGINECPLEKLQNEPGLLDSAKGTTPVFVFSRTGGEGGDLARYMGAYTNIEADKTKHYLEPDSVEMGVLKYLNDNFDNVIVIVNTNNAFELGEVEKLANVTAILWAPGAGGETPNSLADVISGNVCPSGHLVDTFAYDAFSSPAMKNMGDFAYIDKNGDATGYYGISYDEGIYVGYKYYETRYFDKVMGAEKVGDYDYSSTVQYPFGYGKSYTTFEWSNFAVSSKDANGDITVSLDVKNAGAVAGKEVVQVYVSSPYTDYDKEHNIEKAAVSLVGFTKTPILEPDATEHVEVKINVSDFVSYDDVEAKTYILDEGDYLITAANNAHSAVNNILTKNGKTTANGMDSLGDADFVGSWHNDAFDKETYSKAKTTEYAVTNRFDESNYIERNKYLTRKDWAGTFPQTHGVQNNADAKSKNELNGLTWRESISDALLKKLKLIGKNAANNPMTEEEAAALAMKYSQKGVLALADLRGKKFDDANWEKLISQMTEKEVAQIINWAGYKTDGASSINKPKAIDLDGPAGLNSMVGHESYSITYPSEVNIAASWNKEISYEHGNLVAEDGLRPNVLASGWYAPAMNIHRTPFAGRNFEYYSEDAYISGVLGTEAVKATAKKGMYSFIKHFALNDQEDHRTSNGLATWCNEQAMREIYLKPFQMCVENRGTVETRYWDYVEVKDEATGKSEWKFVEATAELPACLAVMSSFNRIGYTWAGGDYRLLTEVLRNEWGFDGFVLTDYDNGGYMNKDQMVRAGGDGALKQFGGSNITINSDANRYYTQQAMKHILYTVVNSNAMNGYVHGVAIGADPFPYYYLILIAVGVLAAGFTAWGVTAIVLRFKNEKKESRKT
ncbi:MAG: glycoside hydrolase family 3 C-terminal domain-containing protein [Clostridia bacterium]|nr:glycoside hydrolase family 3 C-terminal domain-containing protein [Clostridia bacterium]